MNFKSGDISYREECPQEDKRPVDVLRGGCRYFCPRREVDHSRSPFLEVSTDLLLLYGVDYMDERKLRKYLGREDVEVARVLDDSHWVVKIK